MILKYIILYVLFHLLCGAFNHGMILLRYLTVYNNKSDFDYHWHHWSTDREMLVGMGWILAPLFVPIWAVVGIYYGSVRLVRKYLSYFMAERYNEEKSVIDNIVIWRYSR